MARRSRPTRTGSSGSRTGSSSRNRLINILAQALQAVVALKLRTFFCVLSVAIGISAITVIVAATEGAYKKAFDIVASFGPDSVLIVGGTEESRGIARREKTPPLDAAAA